MQKLLEFRAGGGTVIGCGTLPFLSVEAGANDSRFLAGISELFELPNDFNLKSVAFFHASDALEQKGAAFVLPDWFRVGKLTDLGRLLGECLETSTPRDVSILDQDHNGKHGKPNKAREFERVTGTRQRVNGPAWIVYSALNLCADALHKGGHSASVLAELKSERGAVVLRCCRTTRTGADKKQNSHMHYVRAGPWRNGELRGAW